MVIDTSVLIAVLSNEPEAAAFEHALARDPVRMIAAPNLMETSIVIEHRFGEAGGRELDLLLFKAGIQVIHTDDEQIEFAREAYRRFGKGHHRAGLNFGDCFAYALSRTTGEPLLFKGDDFSLTDVSAVEVGH